MLKLQQKQDAYVNRTSRAVYKRLPHRVAVRQATEIEYWKFLPSCHNC